MITKLRTLRIDHIFSNWPASGSNLSVLRVSTSDYEVFNKGLRPDQRRPIFMRAPVECAPELTAGNGVAAFDSGHIVHVRIEWVE